MKQTIWITGAGRGIGKAIADKFANENWKVIASSRNILQAINIEKNNPFPLKCDVTNEAAVIETVKIIKESYGGIDVLVNNAGIGIFKPVADTTLDDFRRQIDVNLIGTFLCSRAVIPLMREKKKGIIVNIVSVAALKAFSNSGSYGASKAGVLMLSRVMREELKNDNIKVISVIPGATDTDIWNKKVREKFSDKMIKPADIAKIIYDITLQPDEIITEEIILRPITGDL